MNNFITHIINDDINNNSYKKIIVRFPPEPNGYLHLGHIKSIILNSTIAEMYHGEFNLRFDDTNPEKENLEYVEAIKKDSFWLVNNINNVFWTSDYFDSIYNCAIFLIKSNLAYVDDNDIDTIRKLKGDFLNKGIESIYRSRTIEENLLLFEDMKNGKFKNGEKVLRAKIDMIHTNLNMRDPVIYRIRHETHHHTGKKWCIYPLYDFAHPISDGLEGISHSLCTTEFEDHKPLYNWIVFHCKSLLKSIPKQIEFSKLEVEGILLSKRKLLKIVENKIVTGWTDSKMPTISGLRNRGFTPEILKNFILKCGFSKSNHTISKSILDESVKEILNPITPRTMSIIDPVEMVIENYDEYFMNNEIITVSNHPKNESLGKRNITFSKNIFIERSDIKLNPDKDFWRIFKGNHVRLKNAYNVFIKDIILDENNNIIKVLAEMDINSKNIKMSKHKTKVAIHWLSIFDSKEIKSIFYNNLFDEEGNILDDSIVEKNILIEKNLNDGHFEFERNGYFYVHNNLAHCLSFLKNY